MRILHTVATLRTEIGGPARSIPGLARAVARAGAEVDLWTPDGSASPALGTDLRIHRTASIRAIDGIESVDLIHDHGIWLPSNRRVASFASTERIPRIVSPRGSLERWALDHKKWKKRLAWWLYQRRDLGNAAALHATAETEAAQFRVLGLHNSIHVVANGVDVPDAEANEPNRQIRTALFLSRLHPKKGLPILVEAWARARPEGWRMCVAGPDEAGHRERVKGLTRQAGVAAEWEFRDPVDGDAKRELYREASLFVLPTHSENFGIVVAEALAHGVPVITTVGAPWEGVLENRCGWWVEPSVDGVARALIDAVGKDDATRREMGQRGRRWMRRDFSWDSIGRRMLEAYRVVLSRSFRPPSPNRRHNT